MTPAEFAAIPTPETDTKEFPFYSDVLGDDVQVVGSKDARSLERRLHVAREALRIAADAFMDLRRHALKAGWIGYAQTCGLSEEDAGKALWLIEKMK